MGIRSSNFNLQKSSEPESDVCVPYPFCPSTHAGMVSQVTVHAACNPGWVKDQISQAMTAVPRHSPWFAPLFLILLHDKATPLLKNQLSTQ